MPLFFKMPLCWGEGAFKAVGRDGLSWAPSREGEASPTGPLSCGGPRGSRPGPCALPILEEPPSGRTARARLKVLPWVLSSSRVAPELTHALPVHRGRLVRQWPSVPGALLPLPSGVGGPPSLTCRGQRRCQAGLRTRTGPCPPRLRWPSS